MTISMKTIIKTIAFLVITAKSAFGQMPNDALYTPKNSAWAVVSYNNGQWTEYWENTRKRDNPNFGTHTTQTFMPMLNIGIKDNLNLNVSLPYISTSTTASNWINMQGFQDLSGWLKYRVWGEKTGFSVHTIVGGSIPVTDYVPDFQPMSIGLQSKTLTGRLLANYTHVSGLYATAFASYIYRDNIKVDKYSYSLDGTLYNTNEVPIPNAFDASLKIGYINKSLQAELLVEQLSGLSGDNVRKNDAPYPTNKVQSTTVGFYGKYQPKNIGLNARITQLADGLNIAQTLNISVGAIYQFSFIK